MRFQVVVEVRGRAGIADPEGQTIERALPALGFSGASRVHVGKVVRFDLEASGQSAAEQEVREMCDRLLANPVIEEADVTVRPAEPGP